MTLLVFSGRSSGGRIFRSARTVKKSLNMNKLSSSKSASFKSLVRGAAMVEYALLLVAVMLIAGTAFKALGHKTSNAIKHSAQVL